MVLLAKKWAYYKDLTLKFDHGHVFFALFQKQIPFLGITCLKFSDLLI